jgi:hypothetical protein
MSTGSKLKRTIAEFTRGSSAHSRLAPHSDVVVVAVATTAQTRRGTTQISFSLLKQRTLLPQHMIEVTRIRDASADDLSFVFAEDELFGLILRINRTMVCSTSLHPPSTLTGSFTAPLSSIMGAEGRKSGPGVVSLVIIEFTPVAPHDVQPGIQYNQITLSEIRPEKRRTQHRAVRKRRGVDMKRRSSASSTRTRPT